MEPKELLNALHIAERLKDATRHCETSGGRRESVAEHSWRLALMAYWIADEFPEADMNKVIRMCLIHDLGEAFTGDIPSFLKTAQDESREENALFGWVRTLPEPLRTEMDALYREMAARETLEARIFKALDNLEAVIQHNESDIRSWSENEYALNLTYGFDKAAFSEYLTAVRGQVRADTEDKLRAAGIDPAAEK
jgi:putative hydrolase of HD superfamily